MVSCPTASAMWVWHVVEINVRLVKAFGNWAGPVCTAGWQEIDANGAPKASVLWDGQMTDAEGGKSKGCCQWCLFPNQRSTTDDCHMDKEHECVMSHD